MGIHSIRENPLKYVPDGGKRKNQVIGKLSKCSQIEPQNVSSTVHY